jgi:tetratricopeptide (TPR) repeat protein
MKDGNRGLVKRICQDAQFVRSLGIELTSIGKGWCETKFSVSPVLQQQHGFIHADVVMTLVTPVLVLTACLFPNPLTGSRSRPTDEMKSAVVEEARQARDRADVKALSSLIDRVQKQASQTNSFGDYVQAALFEDWLCEAAFVHKDSKLVKQAAEAGIRAAEKAVALDPKSAEAHWLLGDLVGNLIPHVFAGGMRYGSKSVSELETAMQLDPQNANAFVSRAIAYLAAPHMFGGDKQKAIAMLKKAIGLDPSPDSSDTAHIWLALAYDAEREREAAVREITEARRLNPGRHFVQNIYERITSGRRDAP